VRDLVHNLGCPLQGRRVLILGAGGATRGALLPLLAEQPAELVIVNRTVVKAQELAVLAHQHQSGQVPVHGLGYEAVQGVFDLVLNASSSSLTGELPPLPATVFAPGCLAYDLTYGKGLTPFLKLAQQAGVTRLADGVGMLAEQAAEAFAWWRGVRPDTAAVIAQLTVPLV
jgi:shikimate dehydrogenase